MGLCAVALINFPCFIHGQQATQDTRVSGKAQEGKHCDAAEGNFPDGLVLPVSECPLVVNMVFIHQSKPHIHI